MIPLSLSLQNFLSYGESVPPLDFSGFHVACISGRNGHGKSALLDAITWALWGEARKAGSERRPNDGLLRIGATEMQVDFEFHLEGDRYRVSRSFRKTGKSATSRLEFQIFSPETGGYKTLSEEGAIRKTQERIDTLLRMNYETFINSAFILQGRADEFTRRNARERKAILSDILGLSRYDDLASLARTHTQKAETERIAVQIKAEEITEALAKRTELTQENKDIKTQLDASEQHLGQIEKRLAELRDILLEQERQKTERDTLKNDLTRIEQEKTQSQSQHTTAQKDVDAYRAMIENRQDIMAAAEKYHTLQKEEAELQNKLHLLRPLEQRSVELEQKITEQRHEVERRLGEWEIRIKDAERNLRETEALLADRETIEARVEALNKAREQDRDWENQRENRDRIERNIRDLERQIESNSSDLQVAINTKREQLQQAESRAQELESRKQTHQSLTVQNTEIRALETERDRIRDQGSALKIQIESGQNQLQTLQQTCEDIKQQQTAIQTVQDANCPLCGSDLDSAHREEVTTKLAQQLEERKNECLAHENSIQNAETEREQFRRRYQDIKNKLAEHEDLARKLAEAENAVKEAENAAQTSETLRADLNTLEAQLRDQSENTPEARALSDARQEFQAITYNPAEHRTLKEKLKDLEAVESQNAQLKIAGERQQKILAELPEFREKHTLAKQWLTEARYAPDEQEERKQIQEQIRNLSYDAAHHQRISNELPALQNASAQRERLEVAEREVESAQSRLDTIAERLTTLTQHHEKTTNRINQLDAAIAQTQSATQEADALQKTIGEERNKRDHLLQKRAALQTQIERCDALEAEKSDIDEKLKSTERDIRIYRELTTAFGKDGIQALIIEQAIPEIEEEANRILSRLTDNRTQIALESLRDLKKGGTRETLDIKISDELGERSYELYSGGEAFRVDFSIRIALSKLLASRTGTRLRTLVIDEGFGTQDTEGLDHLVEAIQAISQDFEKILVITHVESLKQAFPVRIEVTKYPDQGSRFEVLY